MRNVVVTGCPRAGLDDVAKLAGFGVATVHEAAGRTGYLGPGIRPVHLGSRIGGTAVTVLCWPGDNLMIHAAVEQCRPGDVLVVTTTSPSTDGAFGELLATSVHALGVRGVVLDMGCRDAAEITEMKLPLWSRAISAKGTVKASIGSVNVPVVCAGANVRPGDVIVADDDGVVVVPRLDCAKVAKAGEEREKKEAGTRARLQKGELGLDIYDMRKALAEKGLKYVDGPLDD